MTSNYNSAFSTSFGADFGNLLVSNNVYQTMMTLSTGTQNSQYSIFWDYGNTENFFTLSKDSPWSAGFSLGFGSWHNQLYFVSPFQANEGFKYTGTVTYNPFSTNQSRPSPIVQVSNG